MSNLHLTSRDVEFQTLYQRFNLKSPIEYFNPLDLVIYDDVITQEKEETMAEMKKYYTHSGSGTKYDTQDGATTGAKKYMESMSKAYGQAQDIYVLEAIACVTFPIPAYEVVSLDAKATT